MDTPSPPIQERQTRSPDRTISRTDANDISSNTSEPKSSVSDFHNLSSAEETYSKSEEILSPPQIKSTSDDSRPTPPTRASTSSEPKKCWICYSDSTEDDPSTSPWRSPCPCALTAHESCLLDWIADIENPKNKNHNNGKIECPQCKSEIKIARPRSFVVGSLQALDRLAARAILPGLASILIGTTWAGLWWHGLGSMYIVFGGEVGSKILQQTINLNAWTPAGLPLIPMSLIASRTRYAKLVSPFATLFLLLSQDLEKLKIDSKMLSTGFWRSELLQPTASGTFACLPIVQSTYNALYRHAFGELNKKWLAEVQPRAQENNDDEEQNAGDEPEMDAGDVVVDLNIEFELGGGIHEEDVPHEEVRPPAQRPAHENAEPFAREAERLLAHGQHEHADRHLPDEPAVPRRPEVNAHERGGFAGEDQQGGEGRERHAHNEPANPEDPNPNAEANADGNGNGNGNNNNGLLQRRGEDLVLDSTSIAQTILGALVFPVVSRGMGQLLLHSLPTSLTNEAAKGVRPHLLQTRWGRTVVGGAIFVVLKDAFTTYARWRMAKGHRQRRVVDFGQADAKDIKAQDKS
ncbi:MAG: hypothetical protein Q9160_005963 [Pyrenula sp. 1 TL-2023]